jgi:hypothetical protein
MSLASRVTRLEHTSRARELRIEVGWSDEAQTAGWVRCTEPRHGPRCRLDPEGRHVIVLSWDPSDA